jgi:hypothetical protein
MKRIMMSSIKLNLDKYNEYVTLNIYQNVV